MGTFLKKLCVLAFYDIGDGVGVWTVRVLGMVGSVDAICGTGDR